MSRAGSGKTLPEGGQAGVRVGIVVHKSFFFSDASVSLTVSLVIILTAPNLLECSINFFPLVLSFAEMENNRCLSIMTLPIC